MFKDSKHPMMSPSFERRHFFKRTFGPLNEGSIRGSIFSLCAVAIGSGVFSLPYVLAKSGLILGLILIILGYIGSYCSIYIIIRRSIQNNCTNYSQLAIKAGG